MKKLTALIIAVGVATIILSGLWVYAALDVWSNEVTVTVGATGAGYTLSLSVDVTSGTVGDTFTFTETLKQNGDGVEGETVTLYKYDESKSGYVTTELTDLTDENGQYSIPWISTTADSYKFKAYV